jgi:hypothetical protein
MVTAQEDLREGRQRVGGCIDVRFGNNTHSRHGFGDSSSLVDLRERNARM